jgi:hypothetical protein
VFPWGPAGPWAPAGPDEPVSPWQAAISSKPNSMMMNKPVFFNFLPPFLRWIFLCVDSGYSVFFGGTLLSS